ncbi:pre-60S ribosomal particles component [Cytospora paraplurivora]|uniref:Pre-60S ribosomal particles component n=1 Tax=Cytospora paraplurivora TaxID=2898453 RepID=A0AAN9U8H1_9PEZI
MAGTIFRKRSRDDAPKSKGANARHTKKQKKQHQYHSESEDEADDAKNFQAVNLLDSDEEDIHNAQVDDGADSASDSGSDGSASESEAEDRAPSIARKAPKNKVVKDTPPSADEQDSENGEEQDDNDEYSDLDDEPSSDEAAGSGDEQDGSARPKRTVKSKRNDPDAFANSMSKILAAKVSTKNRADPVLARDPSAQEAGRQAVDSKLESKARKLLREKKRLAMEKGRVRDVLVATNGTFSNVNPVTGEIVRDTDGETTGQILETEKRLRKVAQRGVVQLFNAFRTAQVKAVEAEKAAKKEGVLGLDRKKGKVTEMSKKGFLDLIASGGGTLKKGPLEEA